MALGDPRRKPQTQLPSFVPFVPGIVCYCSEMTIVRRELASMMLEVFGRHQRLLEGLSDEVGVPREYPPSLEWLEKCSAFIHGNWTCYIETDDTHSFRKHLRCAALFDCALDCLNLMGWQRCDEVIGAHLRKGLRDFNEFLALQPDFQREVSPGFRKQLHSFNPLGMGRRDLNHWLARQDEVLFDAGFSRAAMRALRNEKGNVARRGTALARRLRDRKGSWVTDCILTPESRNLRRQLAELSRLPGGPRYEDRVEGNTSDNVRGPSKNVS